MTNSKCCTVCGEEFCNKSNLNRHMRRFHLKNKTKKLQVNVGLRAKKPKPDSINVRVLNKVLWQLMLQLIENKTLTNVKCLKDLT